MEDVPVSQEIELEVHIQIEMENTNISTQDDLVVTSIGDMLKSLPFPSPERCIYRVPNSLRVANLKEYTPRLVSIGPFHHGEEHLQAMEEHKLTYLRRFLNRTELCLEGCVDVVRTWEERARHFYAETIKLSSDEFVKMILVDGSFIVELLLSYFSAELRHENDPIFTNLWMQSALPCDTMLLENQLPFFVLEALFDLIPNSKSEGSPSFLDLTSKFVKTLLRLHGLPNAFSNSEIKHFVDFMHSGILSSIPEIEHFVSPTHCDRASKYDHPPTVTELHEAGIKFKKRAGYSLFDIKFSDGILEIPPLQIWDDTESLFRNLPAFEQCHPTKRLILTSYAYLFDGFINTTKHVDLLIHTGIIELTRGSSEDVSEIFNNMCKNVVLDPPFYYSSLCEDLRAYCKKSYHRWKATLKRDYFNTPWKVVSITVALVLLTLTFIQTLCSIISL